MIKGLKRRIMACVFTLAMVFVGAAGFAPASVYADDSTIPFVSRSWDGSQVVSETVNFPASFADYINSDTEELVLFHVVSGNVSNNNRLYVREGSTAHIILMDGAKLYCKYGIRVPYTSTLHIYAQPGGTGELYCDAEGNGDSAIGADDFGGDCGEINIHGGKITADSDDLGTDAAGIGGGNEGHGGIVRIYGGTVKAIGGARGAGIGGGDRDSDKGGNGGETYIYGGYVEARGGTNGAGIGGGELGNGGRVNIYGGTVKAYGGEDGAGIGGGDEGSDGGTINIYGGDVYAKGGGYAAGIGGGNSGSSGHIMIDSSGKVEAIAGDRSGDIDGGAGIGGGDEGGVNDIMIAGGDVTAKGISGGAGIGSGDNSSTAKSSGAITITGGTVNATGGQDGAGIGGGYSSPNGTTKISGGSVTAIGGKRSPGIGGGRQAGTNGSITIEDGTVTATGGLGGAGIGSGYWSNSCTVRISGGTVTARGNETGAGIGGGHYGDGGDTTITGGTVYATGGDRDDSGEFSDEVLLSGGAGIGAGWRGNAGTININDGTVHATGGSGCAGIGGSSGGVASGAYGRSGTITINAGEVEARGKRGGSGIGSGAYCTGSGSTVNVTINGGTVQAIGGGSYGLTYGDYYQCTGTAIGAGGRLLKEGSAYHDSPFEGSINLNGGTIDASYEGNNDHGVAVIGGYNLRGTANITVKADCTVYVHQSSGNDNGKRLLKGSAVTLQDSNGKSSKVYNMDDPSDIAPAADREDWCKRENTALQIVITPCDHTEVVYTDKDANYHTKNCLNCTAFGSGQDEKHVWGDATFTWKDDYSEVTASHICTICRHEGTETVGTRHMVSPATCENEGNNAYIAIFSNIADFGMQSKDVPIPALGHDWGDWTETTAPTCTENGVETRVCSRDDSHTETRDIDALGHDWGDWTETTAPTCTENGVETRVCSHDESHKETRDIEALGHDWGDWTETTAPTCTEKGEETRVCSRDESHKETRDIEALGHDWGDWTETTAPTCTENGVETRVCSHDESHKETRDIEALGHDWGEPTYEWAADNSTVTATRVCTHDASHKETETATATSEITKPATCEGKGETTYTATFENTAFENQTKTEDIDALGHDWGEPTYEWAEDNSSVTAKRVCANDASHMETETVSTTSEVSKPATCEGKGETTYTAEFENEAFKVQTKTVENIDPIGHAWGEPTYEWAPDNSTVTATRVCTHDASHKETGTATATSEITKPATCEEKGETKYTSAAFENEAFTVQTKTEDIDALGHDWDEGTVTKKPTTTEEGVKTFKCKRCDATRTEAIPKLKPTPTPTPKPTPAPAQKAGGTLIAKMTSKGSSAMNIGWNKVNGASGYDVFLAKCNSKGKKYACKRVKTIKGNKTFKWTKTGLKKGTSYKGYVKAYVMKNGKKTYVSTSPVIHVYGGSGTKRYTNAKSLTVNRPKVALKKGKTFKIKAKIGKVRKNRKLMPSDHVPSLRYKTSSAKVATVSKSGKITAKGKGTCYIYVFTHNGISKQIKVTVN